MREIIQAYIIDQKKETLNRTLHFDGKAITYNFSGQVLPTDSANQDFAAIALIFYAIAPEQKSSYRRNGFGFPFVQSL